MELINHNRVGEISRFDGKIANRKFRGTTVKTLYLSRLILSTTAFYFTPIVYEITPTKIIRLIYF